MEPEGSAPQTAVQWLHRRSTHKRNLRLVLFTLAECIDDGNDCPSQKDLVEITGLSKTTVRQALGELEKDGTITRIKNGGGMVKGGRKDCYAIAGYPPVIPVAPTVSPDTTAPQGIPVEGIPVDTIPVGDTPEHETPAIPHVHTRDAAGENEYLPEKLKAKEKDKKTLLPASPGKSTVPEVSNSPNDFDGFIAAIGVIFKAYDGEAKNYYNMFAGRSKQPGWTQLAFRELPMSLAEFQAWAKWWKQNNQGAEQVKKPEKIASSVREYRRIQAAKAIQQAATIPGPRPFGMLSEAEKQALRRAQNFDVPIFKPTGAAS